MELTRNAGTSPLRALLPLMPLLVPVPAPDVLPVVEPVLLPVPVVDPEPVEVEPAPLTAVPRTSTR